MPGAINNGSACEKQAFEAAFIMYTACEVHSTYVTAKCNANYPPTPHTDNALQVCVPCVVGGYWHYLHREMRLQSPSMEIRSEPRHSYMIPLIWVW